MCEYRGFSWRDLMDMYPFEYDVIYGLIIEDNKRREEKKVKNHGFA